MIYACLNHAGNPVCAGSKPFCLQVVDILAAFFIIPEEAAGV